VTRILQVVDEALAASAQVRNRADAETLAVKEASAQPRTEVARSLCSLASSLRADDDHVSYSDIGGES
jgi:hypothetical protein